MSRPPRLSPSIPDLVFLCLAFGVTIGLNGQLLSTDGDLGRHIRVGEYVLQHGLLHRDLFSFTKLGQPFVGYEWLSEALTAAAYRAGGLPMVAAACGLLIGLTYWIIARLLMREGVDPLLAYLTAMLTAVAGSVHWLARPHLFTLLGVALVMYQLERGRSRGIASPPWTFLPLFAVWANLHGGFLFGLIIIGIHVAGDLVEAFDSVHKAPWLERARHDAASLAAGAIGTLLTPYGIEVPVHVLGWFRNTYVINVTAEYLSPDFHTFDGKFILLLILMMIAVLTLSKRRPTFPRLLLVLLTIAAALIYRRNVPLMALTALPVLALHIDAEWRALKDVGGFRAVFARDSQGRRDGPWVIATAAILLALTLTASPLSRFHLIRGTIDPKVFPVLAVEKAREAGLTGRIYNDFIWGGYMLFAWPEQKVFIDGQTDFYGEELTKTHTAIEGLVPGWREALAKWGITLVMVPGQKSLAHELVREPAWHVWYCDSTAVILQRRDSAPTGFNPDTAERRLTACAPPARK